MLQFTASATPPRAPPKTLSCYICSRAYGSASIGIHIESCKRLFLAAEAQKPPKERRNLPPEPSFDYAHAETATREAVEAANAAASAAADACLDRCEFCARTFLPEKLVIHNRSCTRDRPAKPARPVGAQERGPAPQNAAQPPVAARRERPGSQRADEGSATRLVSPLVSRVPPPHVRGAGRATGDIRARIEALADRVAAVSARFNEEMAGIAADVAALALAVSES